MRIVLFLCLLTVSVFGQDVEMKAYSSNAEFSFSYPEVWRVDESGQMGTSVMVFSPQEGPSDNFYENINVIIQDLKGQSISLDQYISITEKQIKTLFVSPKIIESKKEADNKYSIHYQAVQGKLNLEFLQTVIKKGEKFYLITFTASQDSFEKYETIGRNVSASFKVK